MDPGPRNLPAEALKKIDRKVGKEPAYQKTPQYGLLAFGAEAKFRVWLVIDGDTLYADLNGNGDLTDKGERFHLKPDRPDVSPSCKVGDISDPKTNLMHTGLEVTVYEKVGCRLSLNAAFENPKIPRLWSAVIIPFAGKPAAAPVVHFGGPLRMSMSMATIADRPAFVRARIGTPGVGDDSFVDYSRSIYQQFKGKLRPDLAIETPGEKDMVVREKAKFLTDSFEELYLYPVQPGEKGDKRQTKITLSFPDWKDGKVEPSSFSEPIMVLKK